ncbi:uncharacterized protein I206_103559 [Kwoniella pini CBS 10737]|uniref:XPG-I domain-containing protein n=1 Tax=Kwoniella pini CBS 10737 TaxID=1296096 RepID=A0A1B9I971_9TREE|nr:uncharacterized protein I206_01437 [Kwoniella pini CBS 10737]OCF52152.1 hypothetical protein I206_01437 [Kwoniella pini CBS 10737]
MGVPGLWELLRPAAARTSLSALSKEAFQSNRNGLRAFTVGIDASIWIFHAQTTHYGENPFLRTIFFKITALLQHPVLPVFVFDGPNKPGQKRNQNVAGQFGTADHKSKQFKALLDVCGLEWWNAPGEAEAELAIMNRQGKIDAVLSDDVDALLFGATCLLRNNSPTLSGAQASTSGTNSSRGDMRTYEIYRSSAIRDLWTKKEGTTLSTEEDCRMAMVFIALLGGGDYTPEGLPSIGPSISFGLANAGLSDFLKKYTSERAVFEDSLTTIYDKIVEELRTNSSKQVGRKYPDRANKLSALSPTSIFPEFTLDAYLNPCTSPPNDPTQGWPGFGKGESSRTRGKARNEGRGDMEGLALACERYFEWGTKDIVIKKFAGESVGIFGAEIVDEARQTVRSRYSAEITPLVHQAVGTSKTASSSMITSFFSQAAPSSSPIIPKSSQMSQPLGDEVHPGEPSDKVLKIHSTRIDPTNPNLTEFRISFRHAEYIKRCHDAMEGTRADPNDLSDNTRQSIGLRDKSHDHEDAEPSNTQVQVGIGKQPKDEIRVWMSEYLVTEAWPKLVQKWEDEKAAKRSPKKKPRTLSKAPPKNGKGRAISTEKMNVGVFDAFYTAAKSHKTTVDMASDMSSVEEVPSIGSKSLRSKSRSRSSPTSSPRRSTRTDLPGAKTKVRARPCPTSSLSSLPESSPSRGSSPTPTSSPKSRSKSRSKSNQAISPEASSKKSEQNGITASPRRASSPKKWPFSKRVFSKSKSSPSTFPAILNKDVGARDDPIDLCSSSDEDATPIQRRRGSGNKAMNSPLSYDDTSISKPLTKGRSSKAKLNGFTSSPTLETNILDVSNIENTLSTMTSSRSGSHSKQIIPIYDSSKINQSLLFGSDRRTNESEIQINEHRKRTPSPKKKQKKRINYLVVSETSDEEVLDCTVTRKE